MIKVYVFGCSACGITGKYTRKVLAFGTEKGVKVEIINTKYNAEGRGKHSMYMRLAGLSSSSYVPLVVDLDSGKVEDLRKWKP